MNSVKTLDGILFARMINSGAANLKAHAEEINDLNVFPIPDGDTGDNMLMTMMGGVHREFDCDDLCQAAERVSGGMLLSARGNSGVILSQFFHCLTDVIAICCTEIVINIGFFIGINHFIDKVFDIQSCARIYNSLYLFQHFFH